jgi:Flp pilus assembly protein TadG
MAEPGIQTQQFWGGLFMSILCRLRSKSAAVTPGLRKVKADGSERAGAFSVPSRLRTLLRNSEGSTLVETAIVSVFMTTVLLGLFSVAMALISYQQLGYATMYATQLLATGRGILTDPCKSAATQITSQLSTWNAANFTYTVTITSTVNHANATTTYGPYTGTSNATCTAAATTLTEATGGADGNPVSLNVTYAYTWFPILKHISGTLATEFTMLVE